MSNFRKNLPEGYDIYTAGGDTISHDDVETLVLNGMIIKKQTNEGNKQVGRVIVFGDLPLDINTDCDGVIDISDCLELEEFITKRLDYLEDYEIVAMDVNHDEIIDEYDYKVIQEYCAHLSTLSQNEYATDLTSLNIVNYTSVEKAYIEKITNFDTFKNSQYSIEWNEENEIYQLKGVTAATTVKNILDVLPNDTKIVMLDENENIITDTTVPVGQYYCIAISGWQNISDEVVYIAFVIF